MSWSTSFTGKPEKVVAALKDYSTKLSGPSKEEYDKALPSMVSLVEQNFGNESQWIKLSANGHGWIENGEAKNSTFSMSLEQIYNVLL